MGWQIKIPGDPGPSNYGDLITGNLLEHTDFPKVGFFIEAVFDNSEGGGNPGGDSELDSDQMSRTAEKDGRGGRKTVKRKRCKRKRLWPEDGE